MEGKMGVYKKILLAVDLVSHAEMLCQKAAQLAKLHKATLSLIHVVEPIVSDSAFDTMPPLPVDFDDARINRAREGLQRLADAHGIDRTQVYLEIGVTKREIARVASDLDADLIIVGSHGRHGVELLLGSTANAVLHHAHCDVLAVRINK
jgi:universal stress protein A